MPTDPLLRIPHLYHFTDMINMPKIKELDGLYSTAKMRKMGENFCSGGDQDSLSLDTRIGMDQYIHVCWAGGHPMYCSFLWDHRDWAIKLYAYAGFTDIEFNPQRSINCQARAAALFLSLMKRGDLESALQSPTVFVQTLLQSRYRPQLRADDFAPQGLFKAN